MKDINFGTFPTMITPYHDDNTVDYEAVKNITNWYIENGCTGIFAVCQSSEMVYLSLEEKVKIAKTVVETVKASGKDVSVVASGHTSDDMDAQVRELTAIAETGVDAIVWVSNRLDLQNDGDDAWIKNAEKLLSRLPEDIANGIYSALCKRFISQLFILDSFIKGGQQAEGCAHRLEIADACVADISGKSSRHCKL